MTLRKQKQAMLVKDVLEHLEKCGPERAIEVLKSSDMARALDRGERQLEEIRTMQRVTDPNPFGGLIGTATQLPNYYGNALGSQQYWGQAQGGYIQSTSQGIQNSGINPFTNI